MTYEEFLSRRQNIALAENDLKTSIAIHANEEHRIVNVLQSADDILNQLDEMFEKRTSFNKVDTSFLMFATALQLIRIYLLPKFQEKLLDDERLPHDDQSIKDMERDLVDKYKKEHQNKWAAKKSEKGYRSWKEIAFTIKVPYDATRRSGAGFHDRNMHGGYHRVKTLGHDPWLGWIFGVANIITDSITICPESGERGVHIPIIETYDVDMKQFAWADKSFTTHMFKNAIESICEDRHRLYAAIFSQGMHLASDKYTKLGLPIPVLSLLNPDKAYEIYSSGYDYLDLKFDTQILRRTTASAGQAILINAIIGALHNLFYNPEDEPNRDLYNVKTRKILLYSNTIATSSDIIASAIRSSMGDVRAIENFDLGGFLVTLYRLTSDIDFIQKVKEEFIFGEWEKIMDSNSNILNI